ncbi:MAG: hypothetical protein ACRDL4_09845 [Thermoleophilaceae bacterium]
MPSTPIATRDAVHAALVELLTTGQHHHAATPHTLTAVGDTRRTLAAEYGTSDPAGAHASHDRRLAALTRALGGLGVALFTATSAEYRRQPDPARMHAALTELAAITLGWLDTLPTHQPDPWDGEQAPF